MKEEAIELLNKMLQQFGTSDEDLEKAKKCVLICVDKIIKIADKHIYIEHNDITVLTYYRALKGEIKKL